MLPDFMSPQLQTKAVREKAIMPPAGGFSPPKQINRLRFDTQARDNWCWAAVASCLDFSRGLARRRVQCDIANEYEHETAYPKIRKILGRGDCCDLTIDTDTIGYLNEVMDFMGLTQSSAWHVSNLNKAKQFVEDEILSDRPVPVFIRWSGKRIGHFVVIVGLRRLRGKLAYRVYDPAKTYAGDGNLRTETVDGFCKRYAGRGKWYYTYPCL